MKLMARVLDCLDPQKRRRKTDTVLRRVVRTKGKKPLKIIRSLLLSPFLTNAAS